MRDLVDRMTHDGLDRPAMLGIVDCLVELIKIVEGHQPIKGEAALLVQPNQRRYKDIGKGVAFHNAPQTTHR